MIAAVKLRVIIYLSFSLFQLLYFNIIFFYIFLYEFITNTSSFVDTYTCWIYKPFSFLCNIMAEGFRFIYLAFVFSYAENLSAQHMG